MLNKVAGYFSVDEHTHHSLQSSNEDESRITSMLEAIMVNLLKIYQVQTWPSDLPPSFILLKIPDPITLWFENESQMIPDNFQDSTSWSEEDELKVHVLCWIGGCFLLFPRAQLAS